VSAFVDSVVEGARPERTVYVLHGILGSGRNWRSFARRWADLDASLRLVLIDHRYHGVGRPRGVVAVGPDDLDACASDIAAVEAEYGVADELVGHSFGGKVALAYSRRRALPLWILDSPPGASASSGELELVLRSLRQIVVPSADRQVMRQGLLQRGIPDALVTWLLSSAVRHDDGWRWAWDLNGVERLMDDYFRQDLWPEAVAAKAKIVRAIRSDRWTVDELARAEAFAADGRVVWLTLPDAGHWLHVDNPEGLLTLLRSTP
jgi:esterase